MLGCAWLCLDVLGCAWLRLLVLGLLLRTESGAFRLLAAQVWGLEMVDFGLEIVDFGLGMVDFDLGMVDFDMGTVDLGLGMVDFDLGTVATFITPLSHLGIRPFPSQNASKTGHPFLLLAGQ